jgi:hypothetical protein
MKRVGIERSSGRAFAATGAILFGVINQNVVIGASLGAFAKGRLLASSCLSVCPSAWNIAAPTGRTFHEIRHLRIFRKSVQRIQVSLTSDNNSRHFTCSRPIHIYDHISLISYQNEMCFRQKL